VELAGQIRELATRTLRAEFRRIVPQDARVLLFDGGDSPLASFGPVLSAKAAAALRKLGVEQHMHSIVTKVDLTGLEVRGTDGEVTRHDVGAPCCGRPGSRLPRWPRRSPPRPGRSRTAPADPRAAGPDHPRPPGDSS